VSPLETVSFDPFVTHRMESGIWLCCCSWPGRPHGVLGMTTDGTQHRSVACVVYDAVAGRGRKTPCSQSATLVIRGMAAGAASIAKAGSHSVAGGMGRGSSCVRDDGPSGVHLASRYVSMADAAVSAATVALS